MRSAPVAATLVAATSALFVVAGCSSTPTPAAAPGSTAVAPAPVTTARPGASPPSTIYANDPAQPVAAKVGETVALRVDADPAAEEGWEVLSYDTGKLFSMGGTYDSAASTVVGRTVTQNLLFRAISPGAAQVVLRFGRPGAPSPSDSTVTFSVVVS